MSKEKEIIERIPTPLFMPSPETNLLEDEDLTWCYFVFYSDRSTGLIFSELTKEEKIDAVENFFI